MEHKGSKTINTERLVLRIPTEEDYDNIFENCLSNKKACEHGGWVFYKEKSEMIKSMKEFEETNKKIDTYSWEIFLKTDNMSIGSIGVHTKNDELMICEIGYSIHYEYNNKGYATESLTSVLEYLLNEVGYKKVIGKYRGENKKSGRVMEKAGMIFEKVEPNAYFKDGVYQDKYVYSKYYK